eukprot:Nk52_evm71s1992 gene=Nk52_evmTU71s1992
MPARDPAQLHQYEVVGRRIPSKKDPLGKLYRMKIFAPNDLVAKSKFWYFVKRYHNLKRANGEIVNVTELFEKKPSVIKNFGIWLRYDSRTGTHNMYKEFRGTSITEAVTALYGEMAARHRVRAQSLQIIRTAVVKSSECRRPHMKQLFNESLKFPLPHRVGLPRTRKAKFLAYRPSTFA